MPLIEEISDEPAQENEDPFEAAIGPLLQDLPIPPEFMSDETPDPDKEARLTRWKMSAEEHLLELQEYMRLKPELDIEQKAGVIMAAGLFDGEDSFSTSTMHMAAKTCLKLTIMPRPGESYGFAPPPLLQFVLEQHIKPLFRATPHPQVNLESGRKLPHQAGGSSAAQDFYEDQVWKTKGSGCWNVLRWCIAHMPPEAFQDMWPLVVPPIMTMLDDWQPAFRIKALTVLDEMLQRVEPDLLRRTGLSSLIYSSLENSFGQLHTPQTPQLLFYAIRCYIQLTVRTTRSDTEERFNRLCDAVSKGVLNTWSYAGNDATTVQSATEGLTLLVKELGVGTARFLKAIIPQLTDNLYTKPFVPPARNLQITSAECLKVVIQKCGPRMDNWKEKILYGLLRTWVEVNEASEKDQDTLKLQASLKNVWEELLLVCPTIPKVEAPQLQALDTKMFQALITA